MIEQREEKRGAFIDGGAEGGFGVVDLAAHVGVLRALAGEDEGDSRRGRRSERGFSLGAQLGDGVRGIRGDDDPALWEGPAAGGEGVGDVCQIRDFAGEVVGETQRHRVERGGGFRGEREQLLFAARSCRERQRCFLHHDVGVGAADSESADAGQTRSFAAFPIAVRADG